ncbi:hypothetical protein DRJ48_01765 [Candidatus Woesearchaeota archaeon]|nr:hypothetical protein [Candidatus Woesearchaeota archaeon]RLE43120.1 MAG: hypothetical protein DRJ48_01765 [Candidatus Woesearchaeota archaeon]
MRIFRALFGPKEEQLSVSQARRLFEEIKREKTERLKREKSELAKRLEAAKQDVLLRIEKLKHAKLLNENITSRERSIMEGNRRAYINQVELLLRGLLGGKKDVCELSEGFEARFEDFLRATFKSYSVLTQFYETEVSRVAGSLKNLENVLREIKGVCHGDEALMDIERLFSDLDEIKESKRRVSQQKGVLKERIQATKIKLNEVEQKLLQLRDSQQYKALKIKERGLAELLHRKESIEKEVFALFSQFSKVLRKYHKLKEDELSLGLTEHPVETLLGNPGRVVELLRDLEGMVIRGVIRVKDSERHKLIERLKNVSADYLANRATEIKRLIQTTKQLEQEVASSEIKQQIGELGKQREELLMTLNSLEETAAGLSRAKPTQSLPDIKTKLSNKLSRITRKKVIVV